MAKVTPTFTFVGADGTTYTIQKYRKFLEAIRRDISPESKIIVRYGKGIENSGTFDNYKPAASFLKECTEPDLLEYIAGGTW